MGEHSRFSPSGAHIWGNCSGYVRIMEGRKKTTNTAAKEGHAAHWVTEQHVHDRTPNINTLTPNGYAVTKEMLVGADLFKASVLGYGNKNIYTECKLNIPGIHPDCFGTVDAYTIYGDTLYVWDYKFGWNPVEVQGNYQLIAYASGVLSQGLVVNNVSIGLIQPRAYHKDGPVRSYIVSPDEFNQVIRKLHNAAKNALSDNPVLNTGKHCTYCEGKLTCPAYSKLTRSIMDEFSVDYGVEKPTIEMIGRELTDLLAMEDIIKRRISAAQAELTTQLQNGRRSTRWALNTGVGKWSWNKDAPLEEISAITGVKLLKTTHITPKQATKEGVNWNTIKGFVNKNAGVKLVPVDEKDGIEIFGGKNVTRK